MKQMQVLLRRQLVLPLEQEGIGTPLSSLPGPELFLAHACVLDPRPAPHSCLLGARARKNPVSQCFKQNLPLAMKIPPCQRRGLTQQASGTGEDFSCTL